LPSVSVTVREFDRFPPAPLIGSPMKSLERTRLKVPATAPVVSCFEAGRDGFWLHRYLAATGISNYVVDSSSIEVNRRARRAKTDRLDLGGLLSLLARYVHGDQRVWRVVRVPAVSEEDARHLHRSWESIQEDRNRLINRIKGLLITQGVQLPITADLPARLETVRLSDGTSLPDGLRQRVHQVWEQLEFLNQQLRDAAAARAALPVDATTLAGRCVTQLQTLRGVGTIGAWMLTTELFAWRQIRNGRQLAALVGLAPTPYQSGDTAHDQGITRAGNRHIRRLMVQLAWSWLRYQPSSVLTQWYRTRFGVGRRMRRSMSRRGNCYDCEHDGEFLLDSEERAARPVRQRRRGQDGVVRLHRSVL
jgi:transposase